MSNSDQSPDSSFEKGDHVDVRFFPLTQTRLMLAQYHAVANNISHGVIVDADHEEHKIRIKNDNTGKTSTVAEDKIMGLAGEDKNEKA